MWLRQEQPSRRGIQQHKFDRVMSANLAMISDGKKFMWDGQLYANKQAALSAEQSYHNDNFEVQMVEQEDKFLLYTRRVPKEVVVAVS
jgi:hypothetical protein